MRNTFFSKIKSIILLLSVVTFFGLGVNSSLAATAHIGGAYGSVYMTVNGSRIPLPGVHLHRQVWFPTPGYTCSNDAYHQPAISGLNNEKGTSGAACWKAETGRLAVTEGGGQYYYTNDKASCGGADSNGATFAKVGWIGEETGCGPYQGLSCAEWIHRWTPYFPQGYDIASATNNPFIRSQINFDSNDIFGGGHFEKRTSSTSLNSGTLLNSAADCISYGNSRSETKGRASEVCQNLFPWVIRAPGWAPSTRTSIVANEFIMWAAPGNLPAVGNFDFEWVTTKRSIVCGQQCTSAGEQCSDGTICRDVNGSMLCVGNDFQNCDINQHVSNNCLCPAGCGDNQCSTGETCDGLTLCPGSQNGGWQPGECRSPSDMSPCTFCGDGIPQSGEQCDDGNLIDNDSCNNSCQQNVLPNCGNNACDMGETCDNTIRCSGEGEFTPGECRITNTENQCTYCGDGVPQTGEMCDDGNSNNNDGCNNNCQIASVCGNNQCDMNESCDNALRCIGAGEFTQGECRQDCTYCGDGIIQTWEECDDGNMDPADGCDNNCRRTICGNGILERGEECEPNSTFRCGPGALCNPITCICSPSLPGMCGSSCTTDAQCPSDNSCYGGRCRLTACVPGNQQVIRISEPISGGISAPIMLPRTVCTPDGCDIVQCGGQCGAGNACPDGLVCSSRNQCVLPYCATHYCADPCLLPGTALFSKEIDMYIIAGLMIILGALAYRLELTNRGWNAFKSFGGSHIVAMFNKKERKKVEKVAKSKSSKNFETRFEDKD